MRIGVDRCIMLLCQCRFCARAMSALLLFGLWAASAACAGLDRYPELLVTDHRWSPEPPKQGVRVTYLGTNGYLLESRETALLIDPYFSRVTLGRVALN